MPSAKQIKVEVPPTDGSLARVSSSNTARLQSIYKDSPIYKGEINDAKLLEGYRVILTGVTNDGGHTFGTISMDYEGSGDQTPPVYGDVKTGGEGLPASAWVPNPSSPGPGSMNPADQVEVEGFGVNPSDTPFTGAGSQLSPSDSSKKLGALKLGEYLKGRAST
jgi:hypothetical protein